MKQVQALQTKLWSGDNRKIRSMMMFGGEQNTERWENFMGGRNMRKRWWVIGCY
jgi:hypothetical protein